MREVQLHFVLAVDFLDLLLSDLLLLLDVGLHKTNFGGLARGLQSLSLGRKHLAVGLVLGKIPLLKLGDLHRVRLDEQRELVPM